MEKVDISKLSLDNQAFILTGMTFEQLCDYVAKYVTNDNSDLEGETA